MKKIDFIKLFDNMISNNLQNKMPSYSPVSCQLFVYNTYGINSDNRFPLLYFANRATELNFVRTLISRPFRRLPNDPYFVINNAHFLPDDVRQMHDSVEYDEDTGQDVRSGCDTPSR